jgi:hypothetical protein
MPLLLKMKLIQVTEMFLVLHHLQPSHDQTLFQEEGFVQSALMQFPNQQDQDVQQNVQGCGYRIAAAEIQPDKYIMLAWIIMSGFSNVHKRQILYQYIISYL